MDKYTSHRGTAVALMRENVDTDQIMPKQFLKRIERTGFGEFVFYDWRFDEQGEKIPGFVLNDPRYDGASVLISGSNFGCGSSREHAPWGLHDFGFKVIIAAGFADIFYNNCFNTGILPIVAPADKLFYLAQQSRSTAGYMVCADLEDQTVTDEQGFGFSFDIEPFRKYRLMEGLDDIGLTERLEDDILKFEASRGA